MKNTENQTNIGQGITNHFYTQQMIDAKMTLVKELVVLTTPKSDGTDRPLFLTKFEPPAPVWVRKHATMEYHLLLYSEYPYFTSFHLAQQQEVD